MNLKNGENHKERQINMIKSRKLGCFWLVIILLIITCLFSCENNRNDKYHKVNIKSEIDEEIYKIDIIRGVVILNEKYMVFSSSELIDKKDKPEWLNRKSNPIINLAKDSYIPVIYDVPVPYNLRKLKNKDYFTIIKEKDTLDFNLELDY